ncbi:helix-turn-helix domain-containing protein [Flavisphingomonas formosensis]|uniref:helix-turn-helix domain-containing protein n=1 Tax=Flavisphingomonas formosensis TaxID=861534 RepID=UPI0012F7E5CA|nr:helix-turn-helix transcriptional regulator [Sphingomonas formosensis]
MTGQELRALRKAAGFSLEQLAGIVGLSENFIGEMERGEKPIDFQTRTLFFHELTRRIAVVEVSDGRFGVLRIPPMEANAEEAAWIGIWQTEAEARAQAQRLCEAKVGHVLTAGVIRLPDRGSC